MKKNNSSATKASWVGAIAYLAITAAHAWYLYKLIPLGGLIFLSFIGGMLIYFGLKKLVSPIFKKDVKVFSLIGGLFLLAFGALTLIPGWPDTWLLKTPIGWPVLEDRAKKLDQAINDENIDLVKKIAWVGVGNPEPRDTFGQPLINDAKTPEMLEILLKSGLAPDARDEDGTTLLMSTHDEKKAALLLANGADPNARDETGRTPLMYVRDVNLEFIKVLAENGANVNAMDDYGRTVADYLGNSFKVDNALSKYAPGGIRRGESLDFLSHARKDWLDQENPEFASLLKPSEITVKPDPMAYGDVAELQIRLTNDTEKDRVLKVDASLNAVALFVETSHDGKIINPYQPQIDQEIGWPLLALPAHSSGVLKMTILARDAWDAGDLTVDVQARNVLTYADEETIFVNLYQPLSQTIYGESSYISWLILLLFPLALFGWIGAWKFLGKEHPATRLSGRFAAALFSCVFALITYSSVIELVRPYTHYEESEAVIHDHRFYLKSVTSTNSSRPGRSSSSTTTIHRMPIVAASYATPNGKIISSAPASFQYFRENKLGVTVPCWYDPDNPGKFILVKEISFFLIIGIGISATCCLVLAWLALWRRKS